jgi:transcriptional regulator with GAF, ATPase, and Fis domain
MVRAWHYFVAPADTSEGVFLQALISAGLSTHKLPSGVSPNAGPGVVFFEKVDQSLVNLIASLSHGGPQRVLAVATSNAALNNSSAWQLMQAGASDVFAWDHSPSASSEIAARFERWNAVDHLVHSPLVQENLVGEGWAWTSVLRQVVEVAGFTDACMLITGESGTGKELIARLTHTLDPRTSKGELVTLDCTTVVPELSGSEFFGHERGAFTGAAAARDGAFALADGGTLFLDEVGELPLRLQAELLRVVQEGTYKRVGSNQWQKTKFRLICATNKDLKQEESEARFRRDFYYRIAGCACRLPALRERTEDILPLARHFLRKLRPGEESLDFDGSVRDYLMGRHYPGNVRDLKQLVSRMSYRHVGRGPITAGDIPEEERPNMESGHKEWRDGGFDLAIRRAVSLGVGLKEIGQAATDAAIRVALEGECGSVRRAANKLGVTDRALQMRRANARILDKNGKDGDTQRRQRGA